MKPNENGSIKNKTKNKVEAQIYARIWLDC